ncbi:hypothetical protein CW360_11540 [Pseudomonas fluvialis]|uniref:Uncharacterized protein n=1 Tax=Pseudomonas fluvialis TaxID=1793966 RepID=A0A2I0CNP8_9PSED|nr:hypothetical protein [Pseudomonas pharmacofabricae]PKF70765.1 hypothetical protein CW360_11540 [Pseudomonas pharmacofabricae]
MTLIEWPEIGDVVSNIDLMALVASGQGMQVLRASITVDEAKQLYCLLGAGALRDHASVEALRWLSTQLSKPLGRLELPIAGTFTTLHGFFLEGGSADLSAYSRHGHFCETVFGDLHRVSLDWLEVGTGEPYSLMFCW